MNPRQTPARRPGARLLPAVLAVVFALAGPTAPTPVLAQDDMERAKAAFEEGKRQYDEQKYEAAAESFKDAYEFSDRDELLYNIGQAYRRAEQLEKAEQYFQRYLEAKPDAQNAEEVVQKVVEIQEKLASRMATIRVKTDVDGRSVFVDDEEKPRCETPCNISVQPGERLVRIGGEGTVPVERTVAVESADSKKLDVQVEEKQPPGGLLVRTERGGGSLAIEDTGETSLPMSQPLEVQPGLHRLRVTSPSGESWTGEVEIESEETAHLLVSTGGAPSSGGGTARRGIAYGLAGASVALISGGLLLGTNARQTHDILSDQQARSGRVDSSLVSKGRREQVAANILFGLGTATFLSGAGLFTWDLASSNSNSATGPSPSDPNTERSAKR